MKKYLFIALAAIAMFSCNKIDPKNEEPATITYDFTVADKPSFDGATRAVKSSWEDGDKIYVVFDDQTPTALTDFLILKYNGSSWVVEQQPSSSNQPKTEGGTLDALYYTNPSPSFTYFGGSEAYFDYTKNLGHYMFLESNNKSYSVSETGKLTSTLEFEFEVNGSLSCLQICVTGLEGTWRIGFKKSDGTNIKASVWQPKYSTLNKRFTYENVDSFIDGRAMIIQKDGQYIYCWPNSQDIANLHDFVFVLKNTNYGTFSKTFNKTLEHKHTAITFKGPQLDENGFSTNGWEREGYVNRHAYVDMGEAGKWATMNLGASKPEDYGDFYAWGEPMPKTNFSENTYNYSTTFTDAATLWWGEGWRTPTSDEWNKLCQNDSFTWDWDSSIMCYKVTCKANNNSILLPATGYYYNGTTHARFGTWGFYWSSVMHSGVNAMSFFFDSSTDRHQTDPTARYFGQSIRPIVAE